MSERLRRALEALVARLDEIAMDPEYARVFTMAAVHGAPYHGLNWATALKEAKAALKEGNDDGEIPGRQ